MTPAALLGSPADLANRATAVRRENRLTSSRDIRRVLKDGRRTSTGSVICFMTTDAVDRAPRIGVAASKRIGGAVTRNRAKRLMRVAGEAALPYLPRSADVMLLAKPSIVGKTANEITPPVVEALRALAEGSR